MLLSFLTRTIIFKAPITARSLDLLLCFPQLFPPQTLTSHKRFFWLNTFENWRTFAPINLKNWMIYDSQSPPCPQFLILSSSSLLFKQHSILRHQRMEGGACFGWLTIPNQLWWLLIWEKVFIPIPHPVYLFYFYFHLLPQTSIWY